MREKLIEMIRKADKEDHESLTQDVHYAFMADYLIANGVTIPVRCKECKHYEWPERKIFENCVRNSWLIPRKPDDFCSYGERRTDADC